MQQKAISTWDELKNARSWEDAVFDLARPDSAGKPAKMEKISGRYVWYRLPDPSAFPGSFQLATIADPYSNNTYVIKGYPSFYIYFSGDLLACTLSPAAFSWISSYFRVPAKPGQEDDVIAKFTTEFDVNKLTQAYLQGSGVNLGHVAPAGFFDWGSRPVIPQILRIYLADGILQTDMKREGGDFRDHDVEASFWIDLKQQKVVQCVVDGQEMDVNAGSLSGGVPLVTKAR